MAATDTAAAALLDDVQAEIQAEAETPVEEPAAAEASTPTLEPELPADVQAILEEQDDEEPEPDDDEDEPIAALEPEPEWEDEDTKLRRQFAKLTKRNQYLEEQRLKQGRKAWKAEVEQYFPLVATRAGAIVAEATSRKDALRRAKDQHDFAKQAAGPVAAHYEQNIEKIVQERIQAEREALYQQWGRPIGGPGQAPGLAADRADADAEIAGARTLHERVLAKMRQGKLAPELTVTEVAEGGFE